MRSDAWIMIACALTLIALVWAKAFGPGLGRTGLIGSVIFLSIAPIIAFWRRFESMHSNTRMITLIAILVAVNVCARQVMHGFGPSPIFFFTIICGYVLGPVPGFMHGSMTILVSNFFVGGHGPWTPIQMAALGMIGWVSGTLPKKRMWILYLWGLVCGFMFGLVTDISTWLFFTPAQTIETYVAVVARGLLFDISYGLGTVAFIKVMGAQMISALNRFNARLKLEVRQPAK